MPNWASIWKKSDADLLSGTLNTQLVSWLTMFNYPGARPPAAWHPRQTDEMEQKELAHKRASRRAVDMDALSQARELGFESENVEAHIERVFDGSVREVTATGSGPAAQNSEPTRARFLRRREEPPVLRT